VASNAEIQCFETENVTVCKHIWKMINHMHHIMPSKSWQHRSHPADLVTGNQASSWKTLQKQKKQTIRHMNQLFTYNGRDGSTT